jgi:hypothetical protein
MGSRELVRAIARSWFKHCIAQLRAGNFGACLPAGTQCFLSLEAAKQALAELTTATELFITPSTTAHN